MGILKKSTGYTFIEIITAFGLFALLLTASTTIGVNFYNAQKKEHARNLVLEETQFLLNRVANLIRENTIDYGEYYSNACSALSLPDSGGYCPDWEDPIVYGDDEGEIFRQTNPGTVGYLLAGEYERRFYYLPTCEPGEKHGDGAGDGFPCDYNDGNNYDEGYFNTGADNALGAPGIGGNDNESEHALLPPPNGSINFDGHEQFELYLISPDGTRKTILRRLGNGIDDDNDGMTDEDTDNFAVANGDGNELLGIGEMIASDMNNDNFLDGYVPDEDFDLSNHDGVLDIDDFIPITPSQIEIVNLSFFIAPLDDPRKAYGENGRDVQMQPHVTLLITTRPSEKLARTLVGEPYEVTVQTTVSSRALEEVTFPAS